jgi:hypothetical protein
VNIVCRVARTTRQVVMLKGVIRVTRFACDHRMQAKKRKGSQVVVERDSARKRIFIVSFCTVPAQTL